MHQILDHVSQTYLQASQQNSKVFIEKIGVLLKGERTGVISTNHVALIRSHQLVDQLFREGALELFGFTEKGEEFQSEASLLTSYFFGSP